MLGEIILYFTPGAQGAISCKRRGSYSNIWEVLTNILQTLSASAPLNDVFSFLLSGLYRDVQSVCLSVTWRAEDKKQQVLDGKVCISAFIPPP